MKYICRLFTKDINTIQDINSYNIKEQEIRFKADKTNKEYSLDDAEYVVVPVNAFKDILSKVYANGIAHTNEAVGNQEIVRKPLKKDKK